MRLTTVLLCFLFWSILLPAKALVISSYKETNNLVDYNPVKTIVIDPGHGGKDSGTSGGGLLEKDIALDIAMKLGHKIMLNHPNIKVIYTRTDDTFIPLFERTAIANEHKADLFISIHCNSSPSAQATGTETFVMGTHRNDENLKIAKRENQSVLYEENYQSNYGGYDPNSPEGHIILSAYQNQNLESSIELAKKMQSEMSKGAIKVSRGVKQAGFVVLRTATMPSILIETGFLSNPQDRRSLSDFNGRIAISNSIFHGVDSFIQDRLQADTAIPHNYAPKTPKHVASKPKITGFDGSAPVVKTKIKKEDTSLRYAVQVAATTHLVRLESTLDLNGLTYKIYKENDLYKYIVGDFVEMPEAYKLREELLSNGCKGAFLTRINFDEKTFVNLAY